MSDSLLGHQPGLARQIELIAAANPRLASRYAHMLKHGRAVAVEQLEPCGLLIIQAQSSDLSAVLKALEGVSWSWKGRQVALLDLDLDATALAELRRLKASVCAAALAPPPEHPVLVVEGDRAAVRAVGGWASEARLRSVELRPGTKQLYSAGLTAVGTLLAPVMDGAARLLRAAGLNQVEARRILAYVGDNAMRAQQAHGRKAWQNPAAPARRQAIQAQLAAIERLDPVLATFQLRMLLASLEFYGSPGDWLDSPAEPGKARPARAAAHPE
jgi:hypothetical protein